MHNLIIGETCLLSYQLRRLQIITGKNELFDNMIVNLDGVLELIKDDFSDILKGEYLKYINYPFYPNHGISHSKWMNMKYSVDVNNIFSWPVFCFFHYDSFNDEQRSSIIRKTERFKMQLEDNEDVNLFYYYRESKNYNVDSILSKCKLFVDFITQKYNKRFNLFLITKQCGKDDVSYNNYEGVHCLNFISPHSWIDIDDNWDGHKDNDIFDKIKGYIC